MISVRKLYSNIYYGSTVVFVRKLYCKKYSMVLQAMISEWKLYSNILVCYNNGFRKETILQYLWMLKMALVSVKPQILWRMSQWFL